MSSDDIKMLRKKLNFSDSFHENRQLQNERLYVRCARCHQTRELTEARMQYISCKHCYTYYCSRQCREQDWPKHREVCSFSRINTLCKEVIMKVSNDSFFTCQVGNISPIAGYLNGRHFHADHVISKGALNCRILKGII